MIRKDLKRIKEVNPGLNLFTASFLKTSQKQTASLLPQQVKISKTQKRKPGGAPASAFWGKK
ncbi:hypothetical protein EFB08_03875 [Rufibacter latericius]|uniref:Uncharacterized protein n=1 Tax=Rufibacter latericius TaxID=2487040 RepID=A0A3M9N2N1_9BACT|nr:hypothetical protein EFB08_03875 [Rufibacter latericius]